MGRLRAPFFVSTILFVVKDIVIVEPECALATFRLSGCEYAILLGRDRHLAAENLTGRRRPVVACGWRIRSMRESACAVQSCARWRSWYGSPHARTPYPRHPPAGHASRNCSARVAYVPSPQNLFCSNISC